MNEYTRREEIHWTLGTVVVLVLAVAAGILLLVTAQGPMVLDKDAYQASAYAAAKAEAAAREFRSCITTTTRLGDNAADFKDQVTTAKKKRDDEFKRLNDGKKETDKTFVPLEQIKLGLLWSSAAPLHQIAGGLSGCRDEAKRLAEPSAVAESAWAKLAEAGKLTPPKDKSQVDAVGLELAERMDAVSLDKISEHLEQALGALQSQEKAARQKMAEIAETPTIRAPLPEGLFPRGLAIGVGVGIALAALIISYLSLRSASLRRAHVLVNMRRFANTPEAGLQAAAIVRLAAHPNGGEPGMVLGAALGSLAAALGSRMIGEDPNFFVADLFVAGSSGGLLLGLAAQWVGRSIGGLRSWRDRAKEIGDIEKPTIPVVLVLGGVTVGLEKQFMRYFEGLPLADASVVVQKLAAQAEEQILMAAQAQQDAMAGPAGQAPWGAQPR